MTGYLLLEISRSAARRSVRIILLRHARDFKIAVVEAKAKGHRFTSDHDDAGMRSNLIALLAILFCYAEAKVRAGYNSTHGFFGLGE